MNKNRQIIGELQVYLYTIGQVDHWRLDTTRSGDILHFLSMPTRYLNHALPNDTDNLILRCKHFVSAKVAIFFHSHKIEYK